MRRDIGRSYSASLMFVGDLDPLRAAKVLRIALDALADEGVDVLGASITYDTKAGCDHLLRMACDEPLCRRLPGHGGPHRRFGSAGHRLA